jgi:transcriptional regulator with XRE-family HTH domain
MKTEPLPVAIDPAAGVGRRLKELRRSRGLTLAQLAERTNLSVGSLSQLERGLVSPTIRTVYAVSTVLGVSPAWIIDPDSVKAQDPDGPYIVRSTRRKPFFNRNGVTKHMATPEVEARYTGFIVKLEPNGSSGDEQYTHAGEEIGLVLSGSLILEIEDNNYRVNTGDSFAFPSSRAHRFYNDTSMETVVFWINSRS